MRDRNQGYQPKQSSHGTIGTPPDFSDKITVDPKDLLNPKVGSKMGDWPQAVPAKLDDILTETFAPLSIDSTLAERGKRYGEFPEHARITQNIKRAMIDSPNWSTLSDDKKEALEMLAHKMGRILNGDPEYHDSWYDIVGYTKLVADTLI